MWSGYRSFPALLRAVALRRRLPWAWWAERQRQKATTVLPHKMQRVSHSCSAAHRQMAEAVRPTEAGIAVHTGSAPAHIAARMAESVAASTAGCRQLPLLQHLLRLPQERMLQ